jgi:hypothetical protein
VTSTNLHRADLFQAVRVAEGAAEVAVRAYARAVRGIVQNPGTVDAGARQEWRDLTNKLRSDVAVALDALDAACSNISGYVDTTDPESQ